MRPARPVEVPRSSRFWAWTASLGALWGLALGCQTVSIEPPSLARQPVPTPEVLQSRLLLRQNHIRDLKAFVKTTIASPRREQTLRQALLLKGTSRLRLDTLNPFGQPVGIFILNRGRTWLYDVRQDRLYSGPQVREVMRDTLGAVIDFAEFLQVFAGNVPRLEDVAWAPPVGADPAGFYVLTGHDRDRRQTVEVRFEARTLLPASMAKRDLQGLLYQVVWEDYRPVDSYMFPHKIEVIRAAGAERVTLKFDEPRLNQGVADAAFYPRLGVPSFEEEAGDPAS